MLEVAPFSGRPDTQRVSDWHDDEEYEEDWEDDADAESEVVPCPSCGAEIFEDAEQCPLCGQWVVRRSQPFAGRPWWWIALGLLGSGALVLALLR